MKTPKMTSFATFQDVADFLAYGKHDPQDSTFVSTDYAVSKYCAAFSKSYLGKIGPVRMNCIRIGIVVKGWIETSINLYKCRVEPGEIIFLNWGTVIGDERTADSTVLKGFMMSVEFLRSICGSNVPHLFQYPGQFFKIKLSEEEISTCDSYLDTMMELVTKHPEDGKVALGNLFVSALNLAQIIYERNVEAPKQFWPRNKRRAELFTELVGEHARREHELEFYASKLCVTPHYLGTVIKEETGETAKAWIDRALLNDIKIELKYSSKSLKELAVEFNFQSLSAFCKFFKRKTGLTANSYRRM